MTHEKQCIIACQNGNLDMFTELYDAYIRKIYDFIFYKTFHKQTAEDITSTVFLKAFEKIDQCDANKGFGAWIFTIARNTVIDHFRSYKGCENVDDYWDISDDIDVQHDTHVSMQVETLKSYVSRLKHDQRELLTLRLWQGLSYKEIGSITGKSESSQKMAFSRILAELKKTMPPLVFWILLYFS